MTTVSGSFTAVGLSSVLDVPSLGEDITISLSGFGSGTILVEREKVPYSGAWMPIRTYVGDVDASFRQERKNERYRFNCIVYGSGTLAYSISDGDQVQDSFGDGVLDITEAGVDVTGTLSVSGASTLTGAVASGALTSTGALVDGAASTLTTGATIGTMTLADGSITDSTAAIAFGNENLSTTGTLASGALTVTGAASATTTSTATTGFIGANLICTDNVGSTPGTVSAVEFGDGYNHVTRLTVTAAVFVVDVPANVEEVGALIYTFPTGVHRVNATHMDITAVALETNDPADCILACGSTLAAGDTVTFGAATDEDFIDGVAYDVTTLNAGTATVVAEVGDGTIFLTGDSKLFHINTAGTWTDAVAAGAAT
ncbi:hypothetical protein LCGC14_2212420, partial [marine sediment metagenome]